MKRLRVSEHAFELRPASVEEAGLFYSDEEKDKALGTVGHLRMDFGSGGNGFHHSWWPHNDDRFNTSEFKESLQEFVDAMRQNGPLKSLAAMNTYCWHNGGEIAENDRVYGFIAETEHYKFCLRCTPRPGDYQGYLYCYDLRQQEMSQQDKIVGRVSYADGTKQEFADSQQYGHLLHHTYGICSNQGLLRQPQARRHSTDSNCSGESLYVFHPAWIHGRFYSVDQAGHRSMSHCISSIYHSCCRADGVQRARSSWPWTYALSRRGAPDRWNIRPGYNHPCQHHECSLHCPGRY